METSVELFNHGILTERSDIRAHVGVLARTVFVFKTIEGCRAIEAHQMPLRSAYQEGVDGKTADGYCIKPEWINDLRIRKLPHWPVWDNWPESLSTTEKGRRAVNVVCEMLKRGVFPLWIDANDDERKSIQLSGTDVVVFGRKRIQVKCDYKAGPKSAHPLCTGNLYLQIAERNPLKRV